MATVQKLILVMSNKEHRQFLKYLQAEWQVFPSYEWMKTYFISLLPPGSTLKKTAQQTIEEPLHTKAKDGKLAMKIREFLALKRLSQDKALADLLFLQEMEHKTLANENPATQEIAKVVFHPYAKMLSERWSDQAKRLHESQARLSLSHVITESSADFPTLNDSTSKALLALDQYYLREKLRMECAKISGNILFGVPPTPPLLSAGHRQPSPTAKQDSAAYNTFVQWAEQTLGVIQHEESTRTSNGKLAICAISAFLRIYKAYHLGEIDYASSSEMIEWLIAEKIAPEDENLIGGLLNNLVLKQIKSGEHEYLALFWPLLKVIVEKKLTIRRSGNLPVVIMRNLLIQGVRTGNGKTALSLIYTRKTAIDLNPQEKEDFLTFATLYHDYWDTWNSRRKKVHPQINSLETLTFNDAFLKISTLELSFQIKLHRGHQGGLPLENLLKKLTSTINSSPIFSGHNKAPLEKKLFLYRALLKKRPLVDYAQFLEQVDEAPLDNLEKEWMKAMAWQNLRAQ